MGDVRQVPDEDAERSYDAEPAIEQLATEELRHWKQLELAYPDRPGR